MIIEEQYKEELYKWYIKLINEKKYDLTEEEIQYSFKMSIDEFNNYDQGNHDIDLLYSTLNIKAECISDIKRLEYDLSNYFPKDFVYESKYDLWGKKIL